MRVTPTFARALTRKALVMMTSLLVVAAISMGVSLGSSQSASVTVSMTVPSATNLDVNTSCATATPDVTDLGVVLPGTSAVTGTDCAVTFGSSNDTAMLRAYQTDQAGDAMFGPSDGSLDLTFSGDGFQWTNWSGFAFEEAYDLDIQPDGSLVLAGSSDEGGDRDFALLRYDSVGTLDPAFGGGNFRTDFGGLDDFAYGVAVQADGAIVAVGSSDNGADTDIAVARYLSNGTLDPSFSGDGLDTVDIAGGDDAAVDVAIQPDGKILIAAEADTGDRDFVALRYNANGTLDNTFDSNGMVTVDLNTGSDDDAHRMALHTDGTMIIIGTVDTNDFGVVKLDASGATVGAFDTDGIVVTDVDTFSTDTGYGVAIEPSGKVIVTGSSDGSFAAVRYLTTGALDTSWSGDGVALINVPGSFEEAEGGAALQPDGKLVMSGRSQVAGEWTATIIRFMTNGELDLFFDTDGVVQEEEGAGQTYLWATIVQPDGRIVAAGQTGDFGNDFFAMRLAPGPPITDWAGSWAAGELFGVCLHTVSNASADWTLAGSGNCVTTIDANWRAMPVAPSKVASALAGQTAAVANLRYGAKPGASQAAGVYTAPITFEAVAPNV